MLIRNSFERFQDSGSQSALHRSVYFARFGHLTSSHKQCNISLRAKVSQSRTELQIEKLHARSGSVWPRVKTAQLSAHSARCSPSCLEYISRPAEFDS